MIMIDLYKDIMACGCSAHGYKVVDGENMPCCIIHNCTEPMQHQPDLEGRLSRCAYYGSCGTESPSAVNLPFFEYRGEGSMEAEEKCKCGFYAIAHEKKRIGDLCTYERFTPHGPYEYDRHYCGCKGWD